MRISLNSCLPSAALLFGLALLPGTASATTIKNCPTEPAQNVPIGSGLTYSGSNCVLSTTGDIDSFQFSGSAGATFRLVLGVGATHTSDICMAIYAPGSTTPTSYCTNLRFGAAAVATTQALTLTGLYTVVVTEQSNGATGYDLSLERLNPVPGDAVALLLAKNVAGDINPPTAQNVYTFTGSPSGTYAVVASLGATYTTDVCFDVYQPGGVSVLLGQCTNSRFGVASVSANVTPAQVGTYVIVVYGNGDDGTVDYNLEVSCLLGTCPNKCLLQDALSYASGTLTMNFTLSTPYVATWDAWLVSGNTTQQLFSQSQPVTEPQMVVTKTAPLAVSGEVGVLTTFTTAKQGITCSSWNMVATGTP